MMERYSKNLGKHESSHGGLRIVFKIDSWNLKKFSIILKQESGKVKESEIGKRGKDQARKMTLRSSLKYGY